MVKETETIKPKFEPDLTPENVHNSEAAAALGLRYDPRRKVYVDSEGPVRDRFGQPL